MPARFNINDSVRIKLTPEGEQLWHRHFETLKLEVPAIPKDAEGKTTMQLWEVMLIFGPGCYQGVNTPFQTEIELL